uniref:Uncharacterized protein n=1 Tax=Arundo donax TaxID=35708 RepID=A0A0A9AB51_ARUDO
MYVTKVSLRKKITQATCTVLRDMKNALTLLILSNAYKYPHVTILL